MSCKEEVPLLEKFSTGKRDQLIILTMAIDGEKERRIQRFVEKNRITLSVLLDVREKIARTYGVTMLPTAFLIDGEGLLIGKIAGQRNWGSPEAWSAFRELFSLR
jgi:peroxiredoxin